MKSHRYLCRSVAFSSKQIRFLSFFVFLCEEAMYCESLLAYTTYLFNHGSVACSVTPTVKVFTSVPVFLFFSYFMEALKVVHSTLLYFISFSPFFIVQDAKQHIHFRFYTFYFLNIFEFQAYFSFISSPIVCLGFFV